MSYWHFRFKIYQQALKDLLDSIRQASVAIVALFPMALSALLLMPLLALGVLADNTSQLELYYYTLWGYLLLSYGWVSMQKDAVNATQYALYDRSLPVTHVTRWLTRLGLLLYAANVFVLGPMAVLVSMLYSNFQALLSEPWTVSFAQLMPVTGLLVLTGYYAASATKTQRPWLSLGVLPLVLSPFAAEFSQGWCLLGFTVAIVCERLLPLPTVTVNRLPVGLWRFFLQHDLQQLKPSLLRVVVVLLLLIVGNIFVSNISHDSQGPAASVMAVVLAIIVATKLLELKSLQAQFSYYFNSYPLSHRDQTLTTLLYAGGFAIPLLGVIAFMGTLGLPQWGLFLVTYAATQAGILLRPAYYLVFPMVGSTLTIIAYSLIY